MSAAAAVERSAEAQLYEFIGTFAYNPLGFVRAAYPWGKAGTIIANEDGPDTWQIEVLTALGDELKKGTAPDKALSATAVRVAVASGHGIGKTCLSAWIIHWFVSCLEFSQTVVTANTKAQLTLKTWRELAKWSKMAINSHWFIWTATQFKHVKYPETWFASAIPWSKNNSAAFAGTHEKFVLMLFDEASTIADIIWDVAEGALTTANAIFLAFGNPTKNTGRFSECFGRFKHRWRCLQIDSRTAKKANKAQIKQWIEDYGEDSDFVRIRVRGVFPRAGSNQFISSELVRMAMTREVGDVKDMARVLGVDVARHGDDQSCTIRRQGLKTWKAKRMRIDDLMLLASLIAEEIVEWDPDAVFVDVTGMGWGVYDRLRQLCPNHTIIPVEVGQRALDERKYYNRRSEVWGRMRAWLVAGGALAEDVEMEADLIGPEYGYDAQERVQLEKKEDMKARGLASPDGADALTTTFATVVEPRVRKLPSWKDRLSAHRRPRSAQAA